MALNGKIAFVNLTTGQIQSEPVTPEMRKKYLGGRGIDIQLLSTRMPAQIDPLTPESVIVVSAGMLAGTLASTSSRTHIAAKSPMTNQLGGANLGGFFAPELRRAGYDHLVITGRAKKPVYIFLDSGKMTIHDASFIWGHTAPDTQELIRKELEDDDVQAICIGQAGENQVRFASVMTRHQGASGRCGIGAVFGSKNLKAVVARGNGGISIAHPAEALDYERQIVDRLLDSEFGQKMRSQGVTALDNPDSQLNDEAIGMDGCFGCQLHCRWRYAIRKGSYAGAYGQGPGYQARLAWEKLLGTDNTKAVLIANYLVNCYALDALETANLIGWAVQLYEAGIISDEDTGGIELRPENTEAVYILIESIALRKGLGGLLADGGLDAANKIGKGAAAYLREIGGVANIFYGRTLTPWQALGRAVATRTSDHLRFLDGSDPCRLPEAVFKKIVNKPIPCPGEFSASCRDYTNAPWLAMWTERVGMAADMLGICDFHTVLFTPESPGFEEFARMVFLNTGIEVTPVDIWEATERALTMETMFNILHGYSTDPVNLAGWYQRKDDSESSGDITRFYEMLAKYYKLNDRDMSGVPNKEALQRLGIHP